ncbi:glutathione S-transferase L1-like isoform X2 [Salvia splendens]|uniref:glutathione S-transferase L1-like isoform X2 n=1 Tax=Salvia splendens TaxID=180675 RepID=UPI001C2744CE|nr:glutathione S-transferase L1-like isoform X2 [Salvia splendens]XP_042002136.1 glutathione S-transferase L1-like isoform X2 [Salvia splendens]XP_042002137.1 glutathione S-transferase L1-like isoform X2 [Salvia splendens]
MIKTSKGPSLFPNGPTKGEFGEKLLSVTGSFHKAVTTSLKENRIDEAGAAFDEIDSALSNFDDGLFFLGLLSLVRNYAILIYQPLYDMNVSRFVIMETTLGKDAKHSLCSCNVSSLWWIESDIN